MQYIIIEEKKRKKIFPWTGLISATTNCPGGISHLFDEEAQVGSPDPGRKRPGHTVAQPAHVRPEEVPGRALRRETSAEGLREAWAAVEHAWQAAVRRVEAMPAGAADQQVDGGWSFAQTMRHLGIATDTWLGKAVLERSEPYHPLGLPDDSFAADGNDASVFSGGEVKRTQRLVASNTLLLS